MNESINVSANVMHRISVRRAAYSFIKRGFDIVVSIIGLLLLIPVTIIIKIAYMCTGDFGSIIFVQERLGKDGKKFNFYKFRSMCKNADEVLFRTLELDKIMAEEYRVNKKLKKDPRVTKVGKIIRKLSLDELPQFVNVFFGEMSLIGNRPYLPREIEDMGEYYDDVLSTKPGLTGYWQVNGRSSTTFVERLELESYYSKHASLLMDIKIFFKTFKVVLFGKGAE